MPRVGAGKMKQLVIKSVEEGLSRYKWLRGDVGIVESIPKNPTGKVLKRVLVDEYENRKGKGLRTKL